MIFSFFHIWLASVEFRREKSSTWHVASNFLKTMKFSLKSKFEIAIIIIIIISNLDFTENFQSVRKFEATCHVLLFSLRNSTLASQI